MDQLVTFGHSLPEHEMGIVDSALWDLFGRSVDLPVSVILGGARKKVKAYASTFPNLGEPDVYAEHAIEAKKQGYKAYKVHANICWDPYKREPAPQQPPRGTQASPRDVGQLQPASRVNPSYPMRARRRGLEGYVEVSFIIQPDGRVDTDSLRVIDADPANVFDRAVEEAVSRWRFPPADDVRRATQRIQFQLEG